MLQPHVLSQIDAIITIIGFVENLADCAMTNYPEKRGTLKVKSHLTAAAVSIFLFHKALPDISAALLISCGLSHCHGFAVHPPLWVVEHRLVRQSRPSPIRELCLSAQLSATVFGMNTIRDLFDQSIALWAVCYARNCWHIAELDVSALAARLGPHHSVLHVDLAPRLRCTVCGSRQCGVRFVFRGGGMAPTG